VFLRTSIPELLTWKSPPKQYYVMPYYRWTGDYHYYLEASQIATGLRSHVLCSSICICAFQWIEYGSTFGNNVLKEEEEEGSVFPCCSTAPAALFTKAKLLPRWNRRVKEKIDKRRILERQTGCLLLIGICHHGGPVPVV
jgi:hypothetical protein